MHDILGNSLQVLIVDYENSKPPQPKACLINGCNQLQVVAVNSLKILS